MFEVRILVRGGQGGWGFPLSWGSDGGGVDLVVFGMGATKRMKTMPVL
jgi:hypothetical protein